MVVFFSMIENINGGSIRVPAEKRLLDVVKSLTDEFKIEEIEKAALVLGSFSTRINNTAMRIPFDDRARSDLTELAIDLDKIKIALDSTLGNKPPVAAEEE